MKFIKTQSEFPSYVHKNIYLTALRQTPLETSLQDVVRLNSNLVQSCREYYRFVMDMFEDMFENPDEWDLKAGEYDSFLNGKKENAMKQKQPSKTKSLRSKARGGVFSYLHFLKSLGHIGIWNGQTLFFPLEKYRINQRYYDKTLDSKMKNLFNEIPYQKRKDALKRVGFSIAEKEEGVVITSERYPSMFYAMSELAKSSEKVKTFGEHNFFHCEFRQIFHGYTPQYEDVIQSLRKEQRDVIDKVHALAEGMKLRSSCTTYWKINYHFKGKHVMCIDTDDRFENRKGLFNSVRIRVNGTDHGEVEYLDKIAEEAEDFQRYFMQHLNYCSACSTSHLGGKRNVLGRNVRLCGQPSFQIVNATDSDLDYIKKMIEFRKDIILLEKRKK